MNVNNPQSDDRLSAYLDGELAADERAEFEKLLQQRDDYRETLERLQRLRNDFAELPRYKLTADLHPKIVERMRETDPGAEMSLKDEANTSSGETVVRRTPVAAPKTIVAVVGVLAASLALILVFSSNREGHDLAKVPAGTVAEPARSRHDLAEPEAAARQLAEAKKEEQESVNEAIAVRSAELEHRAEKSALRGGVAAEESRIVAQDDMPSQDLVPRHHQIANEPPRPEPAAQMFADHVAATPVDADAEIAGAQTMGESNSEMGLDVASADIPSIVIQTQSDESYRQLIATISQAPLLTSEHDHRALQEGYFEMREQFGPAATPDGLASEAKRIQVIEVTTTPDQIEQLIVTARDQRAIVSNSLGYSSTELSGPGKRGRAVADEGQPATYRFSGAVNRWQQMPSSSTVQLLDGQADLEQSGRRIAPAQDNAIGAAPPPTEANSEAPQRFIPPNDQPMRWRITILPVSR